MNIGSQNNENGIWLVPIVRLIFFNPGGQSKTRNPDQYQSPLAVEGSFAQESVQQTNSQKQCLFMKIHFRTLLRVVSEKTISSRRIPYLAAIYINLIRFLDELYLLKLKKAHNPGTRSPNISNYHKWIQKLRFPLESSPTDTYF